VDRGSLPEATGVRNGGDDVRNFLSLIFFRLAAALHGECRKSDLYVNAPVYSPDGKRTPKYSQRTCRICGVTEEFPWNRYQFAWKQTLEKGEFCELCGSQELGLKAVPWGSVARITTTCLKCRDSADEAIRKRASVAVSA